MTSRPFSMSCKAYCRSSVAQKAGKVHLPFVVVPDFHASAMSTSQRSKNLAVTAGSEHGAPGNRMCAD